MKIIKNNLLTPAILLTTALWLGGCSEQNDIPAISSVSKGDAITFTTNDVRSRTVYGDKDENGYRIWWLDGDKITIHSTDAIVGTVGTTTPNDIHEAGYTVTRADDYDYHGTIAADDANKQMLWKDATSDHTFYAAYPTQRFIKAENGKLTMSYHTNQVCDVISTTNGEYKTQPDMLNAYMMAKNKCNPQKADHVLLDFDPIMTTLDIKVTAGKYEVGTGIINPITVTGVSVIMPGHLKNGELTYNMSVGDRNNPTDHPDTWTLENVEDGAESVFVNIRSGREEGNYQYYLDLFEDESVEVMAFIPPMEIAKDAKCYVRVHTTAGYDFVKKVTTTQALKKRSRIEIRLPDIYPEGETSEGAKVGNNWMARLDSNIPVKKLSIPGYECTKSTDAADIERMLNRGVRVFDLSAFTDNTSEELNNILQKVKEYVSGDNSTFKGFVILIHTDWDYGISKKGPLDDVFVNNGYHQDIPTTIGDCTDKKIIAFQRGSGLTKDYFFTTYGSTLLKKDCIFGAYNDVTNCDDNKFDLSFTQWADDGTGCGTQYLMDNNANKNVYKSISSYANQQGCAGIVMITDADKAYDNNGKPTYSDLLIQAVIDFNFKCNLH